MSLTPAQLVARQNAIGGSDAAAICGKDPYRNPYIVAMRITGKLPADPALAEQDQIMFGNEMEGVLARIYEKKHKVEVYTPDTIFHPHDKQILVHIDRRIKADPRIGIECKNTGLYHVKDSAPVTERWGKPGTDEIPERVTLQCFHGMMCVPEIQIFHVLRCYGGNQYHEYFVPRDNGAIEALYTIETRFLQNIRAGKLPSPDWFHSSTEDAFRRMFKRLEGTIERREDLEHWTRCWQEAEASRQEAEKLSKSIKNRIVFMMANTEVGLLADGRKWVRKLIRKKGYEVEPSEYIECRLVKPRKKKGAEDGSKDSDSNEPDDE